MLMAIASASYIHGSIFTRWYWWFFKYPRIAAYTSRGLRSRFKLANVFRSFSGSIRSLSRE